MIEKPKPFWSPDHPVLPREWTPPKKNRLTRWIFFVLVMLLIDSNLIWWFCWERSPHTTRVRVERVYVTVQGPCVPQ